MENIEVRHAIEYIEEEVEYMIRWKNERDPQVRLKSMYTKIMRDHIKTLRKALGLSDKPVLELS